MMKFTELKNKKRCLQNDVDAMTASADEYVEKAEKTHQLTCLSNSFCRFAKEKTLMSSLMQNCCNC